MKDFPQSHHHLHSARKITQTRAAELPAVSLRLCTQWENGDATPQFATIVKIADILDVSLDELASRQDLHAATCIHNPELHRLYQKVDNLSDEDQKARVIALDGLMMRANISRVMAEL